MAKFDPVADEYYRKMKALYKEGTEFVQQLLLVIRDYKARRVTLLDIKKLVTEFHDINDESDGVYGLLEELAYTKAGYTALLNLYYYEIFNDVPRIIRKKVCKIAVNKSVAVLQDIIPEKFEYTKKCKYIEE